MADSRSSQAFSRRPAAPAVPPRAAVAGWRCQVGGDLSDLRVGQAVGDVPHAVRRLRVAGAGAPGLQLCTEVAAVKTDQAGNPRIDPGQSGSMTGHTGQECRERCRSLARELLTGLELGGSGRSLLLFLVGANGIRWPAKNVAMSLK